jgi:DNA-binding LytR/AlgR family response regulator
MGQNYRYILVTAYSQYALQGYDLDVIDFLHKPFSFDRFLKAVQKVQRIIEKADGPTVNPNADLHMYVKSEGKLQSVYFTEICWIESERNYISIFTETERFTALFTISSIEAQLPVNQFFRVHKSYIIARDKVTAVYKYLVRIRRQNQNKEIPMGESYRKIFLESIDPKIIKKG